MAVVRVHPLFKSRWKQEGGGESQAPVGATVRRFGIVTRANLKGDLLVSYARQFTDRRVDGNRPFVDLRLKLTRDLHLKMTRLSGRIMA